MAKDSNSFKVKPGTIILGIIVLGIIVVAYGILRSREATRQRDSNLQTTPLSGAVPSQKAVTLGATPFPSPAPGTTPTAATPAPIPQGTPFPLSPPDQAKMKILNEILASKNDNDKRLDTDFHNLTPEMKAALEGRYQQTALESRNERGTVAFLLCREIKDVADVHFLASILNEPPCLSMQNCSSRPVSGPANGPNEEHAAMANEVSVVYPQLVVIKCFEKFLTNNGYADASAQKSAMEALLNAQNSSQPKVAAAATKAITDIKP